jgi:hypothetical protein
MVCSRAFAQLQTLTTPKMSLGFTIMLAACWHIWKRRNEITFEGVDHTTSITTEVVLNRILADV